MVRFGRGLPGVLAVWVGLAVLAAGCGDPADWEPRAEVRWVQWKETASASGRTGLASFRLTNTGRVAVAVADLAVRVKTDRDEFFVQVQVKPDLQPGRSSFGVVEVPFRDPEDRGALGGVALESASFH